MLIKYAQSASSVDWILAVTVLLSDPCISTMTVYISSRASLQRESPYMWGLRNINRAISGIFHMLVLCQKAFIFNEVIEYICKNRGQCCLIYYKMS